MKFLVVAGIIFLVQNVMGQDIECVADYPRPCKEPNTTSQLVSISNGCPVYGCVPNQPKCCRLCKRDYLIFCRKGEKLVERWDDDGCLRKTCIPEQPKCCGDPKNEGCEPEKTYSVKVYKEDGCYHYECATCPPFDRENSDIVCCRGGYIYPVQNENGCWIWGCFSTESGGTRK